MRPNFYSVCNRSYVTKTHTKIIFEKAVTELVGRLDFFAANCGKSLLHQIKIFDTYTAEKRTTHVWDRIVLMPPPFKKVGMVTRVSAHSSLWVGILQKKLLQVNPSLP